MKFKMVFALLASSQLLTVGTLHAQEAPPTRAEFNELQRQLRDAQTQASEGRGQRSTFDVDRQLFNSEILPDIIKVRQSIYALMNHTYELIDFNNIQRLLTDSDSSELLWPRLNRFIRPETLARIQNAHGRRLDAVRKHLLQRYADYQELNSVFDAQWLTEGPARYRALQDIANDLTFLISMFHDAATSGAAVQESEATTRAVIPTSGPQQCGGSAERHQTPAQ